MSEQLFDIVFKGRLLTPDKAGVKRDFARLFSVSAEKTDEIFSRSRTVLKKSQIKKTALQYQRKLGDIGLLVSLEACMTDEIEAAITLEPELDDSAGMQPASQNKPAGNDGDNEPSPVTMAGDNLSLEEMQQDQAAATNFSRLDSDARVRRLSFSFVGNGSEYFKIWIVNIVLTIITAGIYSAWAKVRTNRYFYGSTRLDGSSFEYLASPLTILKGRIFAVVLIVLYTFGQQLSPLVGAVIFLLFILVLPWLVMRSLSFRLRNTAYRNIHFGFEGSLWQAARAYSLMMFLLPFSLGLLLPYMLFLQKKYFVDNARYGTDGFCFNVSAREYYRIYIAAFFGLVAVLLLSGLVMAMSPALGIVLMLAGYLYLATYLQVELLNLLFDNSYLGDHQFCSSMETGSYFKLYLYNTLGMILTLGLYYPWAKVRIAQYRTDNIKLMARGDLDHYVAAQDREISALGEEVGDIFDVDIGF